MNNKLRTIPSEAVGAPIEVETVSLDVTGRELDAIAEEFQASRLPSNMINKLRALGIGMELLGVVKLTNGSALVSIQALHIGIQKILRKLDADMEIDELEKMVKALGYLAEKLAKVNKSTVESDETAREGIEAAEKRRRKSFVPGSVIINQQFNNVKPA